MYIHVCAARYATGQQVRDIVVRASLVDHMDHGQDLHWYHCAVSLCCIIVPSLSLKDFSSMSV